MVKTLPSRIFNALTRRFSGLELHDVNSGFKAYKCCVVEAIDLYGELHRFVPIIAHGHDGFVHDFSRETLWRVLLAHDRNRSRLRQSSARLLEKDIRRVHEMMSDHLASYAGHAA